MRIKRSNILKQIFIILSVLFWSSTALLAQQGDSDSTSTDSSDAALEAELAKMLSEDKLDVTISQSIVPIIVFGGGSSNMNPNIGIITKFTGDAIVSGDSDEKEGFSLHEIETSFQMVIDPYARADIFVAVVPEEETAELEEAFITFFSLPGGLKAEAGVFRSRFGKLNQIHPPEVNFVDYPLPLEMYFGGEGLVETGISLSALIPNPWDQFWEAVLELTNGDNETAFNGNATNDLAYTGHFITFFDINDNSTLELGGSVISGKNDLLGNRRTSIYGVDLTYKWRPLDRGLYKSFTWQSEFFLVNKDIGAPEKSNPVGFYSYLRWQLGRRWYMSGRYDRAESIENDNDLEEKYVAALTFFPSNFQTVRFQSTTTKEFNGTTNTILSFQLNFAIGAHGAHTY